MVRNLNLNDATPVGNSMLMNNHNSDNEFFMKNYHGNNAILMNNQNVNGPDLELRLSTTQFERIDDDLMIWSPSLSEARDKYRGNQAVIDLVDEPEEIDFLGAHAASVYGTGHWDNRPPAWETPVSHNVWMQGRFDTPQNGIDDMLRLAPWLVPQLAPKTRLVPQPAPEPKQPTFNCPICMEPIEEETTTKCGHLFCRDCILTALTVQGKCPTCRRKMKRKDTIRVYLPNRE